MKEKGKIGQDRAGLLEKLMKVNLLNFHYDDCNTKTNLCQRSYNLDKKLIYGFDFSKFF